MPPRRKRRVNQQDQSQGIAMKKRKDNDSAAEVLVQTKSKSSNSAYSSDNDDVCMISPPPQQAQAKNKSGKQSLCQSSDESLKSLRSKMCPVPVRNLVFIPDLVHHEGVLKTLGLWELAQFEFDSDACCDDLAQFVCGYDSVNNVSVVGGATIKVSKSELATALGISCVEVEEEDDVQTMKFVEIPELETCPSYVIDDCGDPAVKNVLHLVSNRVCPTSDPSMAFKEIVNMVEKAVKEDFRIDWAALIWSRAEKELLQGVNLEKFYYAFHFQRLLTQAKAKASSQDRVLQEDEGQGEVQGEEEAAPKMKNLEDLECSAENNGEVNREDPDVGAQDNAINGPVDVTDTVCCEIKSEQGDMNDTDDNERAAPNSEGILQPCSLKDHTDQLHESTQDQTYVSDGECDEGVKHASQSQLNIVDMDTDVVVSSQDVLMIGFGPSEPNLLDSVRDAAGRSEEPRTVDSASFEDPETGMANGIFSSSVGISSGHPLMELDKGMGLSTSPHITMTGSDEHLMSEMGKCMTLNLHSNMQRSSSFDKQVLNGRDPPMNPNVHLESSLSDTYFMLNNQFFNGGNSRSREAFEDDDLHVAPNNKKIKSDSFSKFGYLMNEMRDAINGWHEEREALLRENQRLNEQLEHQHYVIQNARVDKLHDQHLQTEYVQLKHRFNLTNKTFSGYRLAVEEARHTIELYRGIILQKEGHIENLEQRLHEALQENQLLKEKVEHNDITGVHDNTVGDGSLSLKEQQPTIVCGTSMEPEAEQDVGAEECKPTQEPEVPGPADDKQQNEEKTGNEGNKQNDDKQQNEEKTGDEGNKQNDDKQQNKENTGDEGNKQNDDKQQNDEKTGDEGSTQNDQKREDADGGDGSLKNATGNLDDATNATVE